MNRELKGHLNLYLILPMGLIILAELLIFFKQTKAASIIYAANLILIIALYIYINDRAYPILILIPLFRLLNMATPVFFHNNIYNYPLIYTPMFIPIYIIMKNGFLNRTEAGMTFKGFWFYLPLAIALGFALGWGESMVLHSGLLLPDPSISSIIALTLIMIFFVGVVEEFIFRSGLQTIMEEHVGGPGGVLITCILFGLMSSGFHIFQEILYVSFAGLAFGVLFRMTGSLPLIAVSHGLANVSLFIVTPSYPKLLYYLIGISSIMFLFMAFYVKIFIKKRRQL